MCKNLRQERYVKTRIVSIIITMLLLLTSASHAKDADLNAFFQPQNTQVTAKVSKFLISTNPDLMNDLRRQDIDRFESYSTSKKQLSFSLRTPSLNLHLPTSLSNAAQVGAAYLTHFTLHEMGHKVLGDNVGAVSSNIDFLKRHEGQLLLGVSSVEEIDEESVLPYSMAGEVAADITFEHALKKYRKNPSQFNKSLMLLSGTDFLRYCIYAFYVGDDSDAYDPVVIADETGISRDTLLTIALAKTMINAYRIYSGNDTVIPYFTVNKNSAMMNFRIQF